MRLAAVCVLVLPALGCTSDFNLRRQQTYLVSPNPAVHTPATHAFLRRPAAEKSRVIAFLAEDCRSSDPRTRKNAIQALGRLGQEAAPQISLLIRALQDNDLGVRREAAIALKGLGATAAQPLAATLATAEPATAGLVLQILGEIGPPAGAAVPTIAGFLGNPVLKDNARTALARIGIGVAEHVTALRDQLHAQDLSLKHRAVEQITMLGPLAVGALPDVIQALAINDPEFRRAVQRARESIGKAVPENTPALLDLFAREQPTPVLTAALSALSEIKPSSPAAYPIQKRYAKDPNPLLSIPALAGLVHSGLSDAAPLAKALEHPSWEVRYRAIVALGSLGTDAGSYSKPLIHRVKDIHSEVRLAAVDALMRIKPLPAVVGPVFREALKDDSAAVRQHAAQGLGLLPPAEIVPAQPTLLKLLKDPQAKVRIESARALGNVSEKNGKQALPALKHLLTDPNIGVRTAAGKAMERIQRLKIQ